MKTNFLLRSVPAVMALTLGAFGLNVQAQTAASPSMPAASAPKTNEGVVDKTKRVTKNAAEGTKNAAKRAGNATKRGANKAAGAVRNTGEKIGEKLPPARSESKVDSTGQPKTAP